MFTSRRVKRLQEQLQALTDENTALHGSNKSLQKQRDALVDDNKKLRVQIADLRNEANEAMEAKEAERRELCDQIGELQEQAKRDSKTIQRKDFTIGRLIKENMWLRCTNSSLADKLNIKPGGKGRFMKKQTAESNENE